MLVNSRFISLCLTSFMSSRLNFFKGDLFIDTVSNVHTQKRKKKNNPPLIFKLSTWQFYMDVEKENQTYSVLNRTLDFCFNSRIILLSTLFLFFNFCEWYYPVFLAWNLESFVTPHFPSCSKSSLSTSPISFLLPPLLTPQPESMASFSQKTTYGSWRISNLPHMFLPRHCPPMERVTF